MPLPPPKKNDHVFQLTLTELAFMLVFLMMLITGWMVLEANSQSHESTENLRQARSELAKLKDDQQARQKEEKASKAAQALIDAMKNNAYDPDSVLADLRKCSVLEPENRDLKIRVVELETQIKALGAFLEEMKTLTGKEVPQDVREELAAAMAFKKAFEDAAGKPLTGSSAIKLGGDCVAALSRGNAMEKERQNLVNQVTYMRHQLEEINGTKGFGLPPCWADNNGKVQRLIAVEVTDQGLIVRPGWPSDRADDAKKLPNIQTLISGGKAQSTATFHTAAMPILEWGKKQNPECRYYASVTVSASRVETSVAGQKAVFDHFFPYGRVALQKDGR